MPRLAARAVIARHILAVGLICLGVRQGHAEAASDLLARHLARSTYLSSADPGQTMRVALVLQLSHAGDAEALATAVSTPGNRLRGRYLTPSAFGLRFGTPQAAIDAVRGWAAGYGLAAGAPTGAAALIPLTGTVGAMQAAFGVRINTYRAEDGHAFLAPATAPRLAPEIAPLVYAIAGMDGHTRFAPLAVRNPAFRADGASPLSTGGTGPGGAFAASDIRAAYAIQGPLSPHQPQTVAIFEAGGFDPHDVATYEHSNHLPPAKIAVRGVNGFGGGVINLSIEVEALLDIDMVRATNPAANIVVYEDGVSQTFDLALTSALAAIASDDTAQTVSISYGENEFTNPPEEPYLVQMAAQGQAVFASSGDAGAYGDGSVTTYALIHPSSSRFVTSVGGTTLYTGPGQVYSGEESWNLLGDGRGATGGGVSAVWPIPAWQSGNAITLSAEASTTMRNAPDVAAVGNPQTGVAVYCADAGGWQQIGGTSVAAPIWAGFYSLLAAAHENLGLGALGFLNPTLYAVEVPFYGLYTNDVRSGTNGGAFGLPGFSANAFYDNVSGWGSIKGPSTLFSVVTAPVDAMVKPPMPPRDFKAVLNGDSVAFSWLGDAAATGYLLEGEVFDPQSNPGYFSAPRFVIGKGNAAVLGHLKPATLYHFRLNAINRGGATHGGVAILKTH